MNIFNFFGKKENKKNETSIEIKKEISEDFEIISEDEIKIAQYKDAVRQEFMKKEHLAKNIIYKLHSHDGNHRVVAELWCKRNGYTVKSLSPEALADQGIYIDAFVPNDPTKEVIIACRGTNPFDASIVADLYPKGPGAQALAPHMSKIMEKFGRIWSNHSSDKLSIVGHSLGGALSDQINAQVLYCKAHAKFFSGPLASLKSLKRLAVITYQGAGVSECTEKKAEESAKIARAEDPDFQLTVNRAISKYDLVHKTGKHPFSSCDSSLAEVNVIKQDISATHEHGLSYGIKDMKRDGQNLSKELLWETVFPGAGIMGGAKNVVISSLQAQIGKTIAFRAAVHKARFSVDSNGKETGRVLGIRSNQTKDTTQIRKMLSKNSIGHRSMQTKMFNYLKGTTNTQTQDTLKKAATGAGAFYFLGKCIEIGTQAVRGEYKKVLQNGYSLGRTARSMIKCN